MHKLYEATDGQPQPAGAGGIALAMPKASNVEKQPRALCVELVRVTDSKPMQYRMAQEKAVGIDEAAADVAIVYAVEKGWLLAEGNPPHSICLTDDGRVLSLLCDGERSSAQGLGDTKPKAKPSALGADRGPLFLKPLGAEALSAPHRSSART
jgi:hypothetical protein